MNNDEELYKNMFAHADEQREQLYQAMKELIPLVEESMTMFQQNKGMMYQDMAKQLGKPLLNAKRVVSHMDAMEEI